MKNKNNSKIEKNGISIRKHVSNPGSALCKIRPLCTSPL